MSASAQEVSPKLERQMSPLRPQRKMISEKDAEMSVVFRKITIPNRMCCRYNGCIIIVNSGVSRRVRRLKGYATDVKTKVCSCADCERPSTDHTSPY